MPRSQILRAVPTVDHFKVVEMGVRGATEKDVLEDPATGALYIAKLGRRNNDLEVMTEYALFLVGSSLPIDVAEGQIATYKGRLRFLSRYFLDQSKAEELVHGMQLFKELYDEGTVDGVLRKADREQAFFTVQSIKAAFGAHYGTAVEEKLFGGFVDMLTHDAILGVMDRHHENWGLVVQRTAIGPTPRFAPLYDSARGLFCTLPDDHLEAFAAGGHAKLTGYLSKARPFIGFEGLEGRGGRSYVNHFELVSAVFRAYREQRARITAILAAYDWRLVHSRLSQCLHPGLCRPRRRQLMLDCIRRRIRAIRRHIHGRP